MTRTLEEIMHHGWDGQPAPKSPEFGDPELLPKPVVLAWSAERPWYDLAGRALPDGPELPPNFTKAPDIEGKPWQRRRGDEWTDAAMRAVVFAWLGQRFQLDRQLTRWEVIETSSETGATSRDAALRIRLWRGAALRDVASMVPRNLRNPEGMRAVLAAFEPGLTFD